MKTRKYKDNQQRKNFVQNESKIFLTQYFKKIEKVKTFGFRTNEVCLTKDSNLNYGSQELQLLSPSVAAAEAKLPLVPRMGHSNATRSGAFSGALKPQVLKSLEIWKYPKNLSTFFLERPSLQSTYLLMKLKDQVSEIVSTRDNASKSAPYGAPESWMNFVIKDLAFQVCYSTKMKQQQNKTRIHGRCIQSNRPRSVSRLLRLSRIRTRTLALEGKITGCARSTW